MREFFKALKGELEKGERVVIAAVYESEGSVPQKSGAYMLVGKTGRIFGTVGGGAIEYEAEKKALEMISKGEKALVFEAATDGEGIVCGGKAKLLLVLQEPCYIDFVEKALKASAESKPYFMLLPFNGGRGRIEYDIKAEGKTAVIIEGEKYYFGEFNRDGRVYIFGGGHLGTETAPLLSHLGFSVTVIDDRAEFAEPKNFNGAERVLRLDFDKLDSLDCLEIGENDYIAVMTRGHSADFEVLKFALKTKAGYIGVVGSKAKTEFVNKRLINEGFSCDDLKRIVTPIGIDIGSKTPAEIAVSIAAQLIKVRAEKFGKNG